MWIFPSYLKSLWKYIRVETMTISFFGFFFFPWIPSWMLIDVCMQSVHCASGSRSMGMKAEQVSFGEFHLNLDITAAKANSAYVPHWLKDGNLSHGAVYWKICDFFRYSPLYLQTHSGLWKWEPQCSHVVQLWGPVQNTHPRGLQRHTSEYCGAFFTGKQNCSLFVVFTHCFTGVCEPILGLWLPHLVKRCFL